MLITIGEKEVDIKSISCGLNGAEGVPYDYLTINVYVSLTHECNANCKFCTYHYPNTTCFDFEKFKVCIDSILDSIHIFKLSFTGGEPTLDLELLQKCLSYVKSKDSSIFTILNTNGKNLKQLENIVDLDNIALSRHAVSDEENMKIFGCDSVATYKDIQEFKYKYKLHLSCNLIRGIVYTNDTILQYLEMCSKLGVTDVGFVSLMPTNSYAKEKGIDFSEIDLEINKRFIINKYYTRTVNEKCVCKCRNYLYFSDNGVVVKVYSRYYIDNTCVDGALVYIDNNLRSGFTGSVIL